MAVTETQVRVNALVIDDIAVRQFGKHEATATAL
jgi:hypothetical protein